MAEETKVIRIIIDAGKAVDGSAAATRALANLERSQQQAADSLGRMEQALGRMGGVLKAQLGLMIADLGARLVQMGKDSLNAVAGLDELAEQLGVTTTGLQAMQFSAVQNGVKFEQLETALGKFSQKMGSAAEGSKEMVDALNAIGVKNLDAQGKLRSTEALMQDVAVAILKVEDPARRAALSVEFFGKSGMKLLPMLSDIASGTDAMAARAKAAGAMVDASVIKQLDKMSDEAAKSGLKMRALFAEIGAPIITESLEKVNGLLGQIADQLERGKQSGKGFWATVLADSRSQGRIGTGPNALRLSTPAEEEADRRAKLQAELNDPNNAGRRAMIQEDLDRLNRRSLIDRQAEMHSNEDWARRIPLPPVIGEAPGASLSTVKGAGQSEGNRIAKLLRDNARDLDAANAFADASTKGAAAVGDLEIKFKALKAAQDAFGDTADKNTGQVNALAKKIEELMSAADRAKALKDFNLGTEELDRANELLAAENGLLNATNEERAREIALIRVKHEVQSKGLDESNEKEKEAIERRRDAVTLNERLKGQAEELKKANELWTEPLKNALQSIQSTAADLFDRMLESGKLSFDELGNIAMRTARRMVAEFMALAMIRPMMGSVVQGLGSIGLVSPQTAASLGYGGAGGIGGGMPSLGGGGFGGGSMFGFLSQPIFGGHGGYGAYNMGADVASLTNTAMPGGFSNWANGITWGQGLGAVAGLGGGIYSLATANGNTGKTIGGIGQIIGAGVSLIPGIGQIAGPLISLASSILPGLFGGEQQKYVDNQAYGQLNYGSGGWSTSGGAWGPSADARSLQQPLGQLGQSLDAIFGAFGGVKDPGKVWGMASETSSRTGGGWNLNQSWSYLIDPATGAKSLWRAGENNMLESGGAQVAIRSILGGAVGEITESMRTALYTVGQRGSSGSLGQVAQAVEFVLNVYDKLGKTSASAADAIKKLNAEFDAVASTAASLGLSLAPVRDEQAKQVKRLAQDFLDGMLDPQAVAMRQLEDQRKDSIASAEYIRDNVKDVYVDMAKITEYWNRKRLDLEAQYQEQSVGQLQALIRRLTYGDLANASPDTSLAGTRGTYEATLAQARAGSGTARANLAGYAEAYVSSARSYFASSAEYDAIVASIRTALLEVVGGTGTAAGGAANGNNPLLQTVAEQSGMVAALVAELREVKDQLAAATAQMQRRG